MDIVKLLKEAEADGVRLRVVQDELKVGVPAGKEHWLDKLAPHKEAILRHIQGEPAEAELPPAEPPDVLRYLPFPIDALPPVVGDYVSAAATAIGCDPSFVALPLLACLARAIGNARVIRIKRKWTESAIIWAAIVGKSGTHKSPAMKAAVTFLEKKQEQAVTKYRDAMTRYDEDKARYDKQYTEWKRSKKPHEPPPWEPEPPKCLRYLTTDITIEALAVRLSEQFDGLIVIRDELAGWLNGMGEYKGGKGSDAGHWLSMYSAAPLTVDRKTGLKQLIHVPRAAVSIVGGIQPGILLSAIGREHRQDGLCARLLLAKPEPKPVRWTEGEIDEATESSMGAVFDHLLSLEPAADADGNDIPFPIDLSPEAKDRWVQFYNQHRAEMADLNEDLASAWAKLEAYTARFALIFQLCLSATDSGSSKVVEERALRSAITLTEWFGNEAKRVYALFHETLEEQDVRELEELVHRKGGRATPRDLMRSSRKWERADEAEAALQKLVDAGRGSWSLQPPSGKGGRPTRVFVLNGVTDVDTTSPNPGESNGSVNVNATDNSEQDDEWGEL
ncbi:YfjI family protein [Aeoliella sp. ICT_H6.2]|uniref:YfjI family protein n=1 Tax=Aeoliella straminimaris TaxID=2954799 RepID=A0A9X2JIP3_9BACT|nr:YfjI family protein [Aeoliella straminimaris]